MKNSILPGLTKNSTEKDVVAGYDVGREEKGIKEIGNRI